MKDQKIIKEFEKILSMHWNREKHDERLDIQWLLKVLSTQREEIEKELKPHPRKGLSRLYLDGWENHRQKVLDILKKLK